MNKELKHRVFDLPQDILDKINFTLGTLNGKSVRGAQRAKKLLQDKKVKYGQLKRIIHDIQGMDKIKERIRYELCGGELMEIWSKQFLKGERDLVQGRKDSRKRADEIGAIEGQRQNSHIKRHTKRFNFKISPNMVKNNSQKSTVSPIVSLGLFEEINKIKNLIKY